MIDVNLIDEVDVQLEVELSDDEVAAARAALEHEAAAVEAAAAIVTDEQMRKAAAAYDAAWAAESKAWKGEVTADWTKAADGVTRAGNTLRGLIDVGRVGRRKAAELRGSSALERKLRELRARKARTVIKSEATLPLPDGIDDLTDPNEIIIALRTAKGHSWGFAAIAEELTRRGVPTPRGGKRWHPLTIRTRCEKLGIR